MKFMKKYKDQLAGLCKAYPVDFYLLMRSGANSAEVRDIVMTIAGVDPSNKYAKLLEILYDPEHDAEVRDLLAAEAPSQVTEEELFSWISIQGAENIADTGCRFYIMDDDEPNGYQTQCESLLRELLDRFVTKHQKPLPVQLTESDLAVLDRVYQKAPAAAWVWAHICGHWLEAEEVHQLCRAVNKWSSAYKAIIHGDDIQMDRMYVWRNVMVQPKNLPAAWDRPSIDQYTKDKAWLKQHLDITVTPAQPWALGMNHLLLYHLNALADKLLEGGQNEKLI